MAKERFLTVLVPIKDSDCEATTYSDEASLIASVPPSASNTDKVYKLKDGTYRRSTLDLSQGAYYYMQVTDREFPYLGEPLMIYDFTYDATRMGAAPTISAQGVMRYAEKDGEGADVTLEDLWTQECHVLFNGEKFYIKQIPTSSKSNEDARYKYDMDFVSERSILERVYIYDVVSPFVTEKPISENSTFSFFGDISALAERINASLIRSGLASLTRKYVPYPNMPNTTVPYLKYEQWNQINVNPQPLIGTVFSNGAELNYFRTTVYVALQGDYSRYLMEYVYENDGGVYSLTGYQCKIGKDKKGETATSEEKIVSFDKNTIQEALAQFHDTFETDYYVTKEKDTNGEYTGNTFIMVADCENDFADWNGDDYVRDDNGIPTTSSPFDYGAENEFLSKEKTNTSDKIVTRITGTGSSENIPWYYPNPNPDGWIRPVYKKKGVEQQDVTIDYPSSEGTTTEENARFEKYIRNRIGTPIKCGAIRDIYTSSSESLVGIGGAVIINPPADEITQYFQISGMEEIMLSNMTLSFHLNMYESGCTGFSAQLYDKSLHTSEMYDSSESYAEPTDFQKMCENHDGTDGCYLIDLHQYTFGLTFKVPDRPQSRIFDYEGYRYPEQTITVTLDGHIPSHAYIGENFYKDSGLVPFVKWHASGYSIWIDDAGYSTNGEADGKVTPIPRIEGKQYRNAFNGSIYKCKTSSSVKPEINQYLDAFDEGPSMSKSEWKRTFLDTAVKIYETFGWFIGSEKVNLEDYGLGYPEIGGTAFMPSLFDTIEFQRVKWLTPQQTLMPEVFVKTDGERRFYNAHNYYPLQVGTADTAIGEQQSDNYVVNPIYKEIETDTDDKHYVFESEYNAALPNEHIESMEDVKATIKEQTVTIDGRIMRIDVVEEFAYDVTDNDEIWESSDGGSVQGEYKHPYFFAKLRPLGFNLFDLALQDDMVLSMTTGQCGACNFKIGVDEKTKKNPVQVWEYDVYGGDTFEDKGEKIYGEGEPRRYVNLDGLYYDTNGQQSGYVSVKNASHITGVLQPDNQQSSVQMYNGYTYSVGDVENGYVGTAKKSGNAHFEGDVVTSGRFIERQQDTTENYVWVALMKDTETYGVIMPSARPYYDEHQFDIYIRPKSIADVHTEQSTAADDEENADKFVLTNIMLPQVYLRRAEHNLSRKLVKYMQEHNWQKFNFSVKFSRIFLEQNVNVNESLNENSVIYILFNRRIYRQYVKHYTYRMSHGEALPEINIDTNQELPVTMAFFRKQEIEMQRNNRWIASSLGLIDKKIKGNEMVAEGVVINATSTSTSTSETNIYSLEWEEF